MGGIMIYAQIKNQIVKNCLILEEYNASFLEGYDSLVRIDELSPRPGIGWSYDGTDFSAPVIEVLPEVIADVTPRQMRLQLLSVGITEATIDGIINSLSSPTKEAAMITWKYSTAFQRHNALVPVIAAILGYNDTQLDQMWKDAALL